VVNVRVTGEVTEAEVRAAVEAVPDPELPVLTLADLGVLRQVTLRDRRVLVRLTPTYVACPALGAIKDDVRRAVASLGLGCDLEVVLSPPWHPGLISERGRARLAAAGIAPPESSAAGATDLGMPTVRCPRCGDPDTRVVSHRGPTPCTSLHVCGSCREPFEKVRER
jgi:ring-1,2-phenylacetyl-CoA epoxidase subunit PaaD